ncbi:MAG: molecular chaperone [Anaerolineales bacterium]|nr:MAG: molecular chaperone [Anaerolineales bacterium]
MTFYLQTFPYNRLQQRPIRRVIRQWDGNDQHTLGVNIREEEEAYILSALVPGLKSDDLNIQVLEDIVRIEGEYKRSDPADKQDENQYLMRELPHGSFTRTLRLPTAIEADRVEAKITDGVLTLTLPKAESARPKKIKIVHK